MTSVYFYFMHTNTKLYSNLETPPSPAGHGALDAAQDRFGSLGYECHNWGMSNFSPTSHTDFWGTI